MNNEFMHRQPDRSQRNLISNDGTKLLGIYIEENLNWNLRVEEIEEKL